MHTLLLDLDVLCQVDDQGQILQSILVNGAHGVVDEE